MIEAAVQRAVSIVRASWFSRVFSTALAAGISSVFTLSALLVPSPSGHGTHLQLGLGQCTFLQLTGLPCPMCGATTSFTLMAHLDPIAAFANQPFASSLFLLAALLLGVAIAEVIEPRDRWGRILRWLEPREVVLAAGFLGFMVIAWGYKIALMKF